MDTHDTNISVYTKNKFNPFLVLPLPSLTFDLYYLRERVGHRDTTRRVSGAAFETIAQLSAN